MTEQPNSDQHPTQSTLHLLQTRLLPLAQRIAGVARGMRGFVGFVLVISAASALWLMIYLQEVFNFSLGVGLVVLLALGLPAIVLGILYIALHEAINLVDETNRLIAVLSNQLGDVHKQAAAALQAPKGKRMAIGSLFSLGAAVREIVSLGDDVGGLALKFKGLLLACNPLYLVAVVISFLATIVLTITAIITVITLAT